MNPDKPSEASEHAYPVVITPLSAEDGAGYLATVPDLPGCTSEVRREEAARNAGDAIAEWIDEAKRLGREVPAPAAEPRPGETVRVAVPRTAARHFLTGTFCADRTRRVQPRR